METIHVENIFSIIKQQKEHDPDGVCVVTTLDSRNGSSRRFQVKDIDNLKIYEASGLTYLFIPPNGYQKFNVLLNINAIEEITW